jgi:chromosomal replication initiation ATPase DnaA
VRTTRGSNNNVLRWVAMYLCQEVCDYRLVKIASYFSLKRAGSVPTKIKKPKQLMNQDKTLMRMLDGLKKAKAIAYI